MLDDFKIDGGLVAAIGMILAGLWGTILKIFSIAGKIDRHDLHLAAHDRRMEEIEAHMENSHTELKDIVKSTEAKLDRLIEKLIPQQRGIQHEPDSY